jgi:hypothetical protein
MTVVTVAIRNEKAIQLLKDLADMDLIELLQTDSSNQVEPRKKKLSDYIGKLNTGKSIDALDTELNQLRGEWDRTI